MLKSALGPIAVAVVLISQSLSASELREADSALINAVNEAQATAVTLLECSSKKDVNSCKDIQELVKNIHKNEELIALAKVVLNRSIDLVHQAVVNDEAKIAQLEQLIFSKPKAEFRYQQIIMFAKLQIAAATKPMRRFIAIFPEIERINRNMLDIAKSMENKDLSDATEILVQNKNDMMLNLEKWTTLQSLLQVSLGLTSNNSADKTLALILNHAREGSVVYQIPPTSLKVSGMLPFFCEKENPTAKGTIIDYCESDLPVVRFNVELLKAILGDHQIGAVEIVLEKAWSEKIGLGDVLAGLFYDMRADPKKRTIHISYYETQTCDDLNPELRRWVPGLLCNGKVTTTRHPNLKQIEKTLFDMLNISDESLKLHSSSLN